MHLERKLNKRDRLNEELSLIEKHHLSNKDPESNVNEKIHIKQSKIREKTDELDRHVSECSTLSTHRSCSTCTMYNYVNSLIVDASNQCPSF